MGRSNRFSDPHWLREKQYSDASNLSKRISLHERFSTARLGWHPWVFSQLSIPADAHILEIGCGPGLLWDQNSSQISSGWTIRVSDFSPGMVAEARTRLEGLAHFSYITCDAQAVPFPGSSYDVVVANHMLYHVPSIRSALREISRVLKPSGTLYAATNGESHLQEMANLVSEASGKPEPREVFRRSIESFSLQSATGLLKEFFGAVTIRRYEDSLRVKEARPIVEFVASSSVFSLSEQELGRLEDIAKEQIAARGAIHITKDAGIVIASTLHAP